MKRHSWKHVDPEAWEMICEHCGTLISDQDTEQWNLEIYADCPSLTVVQK